MVLDFLAQSSKIVIILLFNFMLNYAKQITKEAGKLALGYYKDGVAFKVKSEPSDLVTEADTAVNDFLVKKIKKKFPKHGIISEELEEPINPHAEYVWVLDPIDGTGNFAAHIPMWCVMVGIEKKGKPFIGVVYDPIQDELYYAEAGKGAFLNGKKIHVNNKEKVDFSFLSVCPGRYMPGNPYSSEEYPRYAKFLQNLMGDKGFWFTYYRCNISFCHLAKGSIDGVIMNGCLYHDYLAPYVIATEAGAKFTDSYGKKWTKEKKDSVIANPKMHKNLLRLF